MSLSLQPLIPTESNESTGLLHTGRGYLCYLITEDAKDSKQLVICDATFDPDSIDGEMIKVQSLEGDALEAKKQQIKILLGPGQSDFAIDLFELVSKVVRLAKPDALRMALEQQVISTETRLSQSDGDSLLNMTSRIGSAECLIYLLVTTYSEFPFELTNDKGQNILHSAVKGGKMENIELILDFLDNPDEISSEDLTNKKKTFLNTKTKLGNNALHMCVTLNKYDPICLLLKAGIELREGNSKQNTILHLSADKDQVEIFKRIANYYITGRDDKDDALNELKECFQSKNADRKIPILLTKNRPTIDIILKYSDLEAEVDEEFGNLICVAAAEDNYVLIQALIDLEVPLDVANVRGFSPLRIAAKRGNCKVLKVLLENKANPNYIGRKIPGFSALNNAAQFGQIECLKILIAHGANLLHKDMHTTALHSAAFGGNTNVVEYLVNEIGMNVNQKNKLKKIPLYQGIIEGHNSVVSSLLRLGADPNFIMGEDNETPLHFAVMYDKIEIVSLLLEARPKPDEPNRNGMTPLMLAGQNDHADYMQLLVAHGVTLSKKDVMGNTVLHHIAKNDSCSSAKFLLRRMKWLKGITPKYQLYENKNEEGKTPYDVSLECRNISVLKIFLTHAPGDYFTNHPQQIHHYYELKLYEIIQQTIQGLICISENEREVRATNLLIFDSTEDGEVPTSKGFKPLKESFLHKLKDCPDPEIKYHPLVNLIVDKKLSFYRWWYIVSFVFYAFFLICLGYALIYASLICDSELWLYQSPADWARGACELISILYLLFFIFNEVVEFLIEWTQVYEENKNKPEEPKLFVTYVTDSNNDGINNRLAALFSQWRLCTDLFHQLDIKLKYFFSAFPNYFDSVYNFIDWLAMISFIILIILRISGSYIQWSFAGMTFIFFSLTLFKYTRISPALGAYVSGVFRIFVIDIPRFFVLIVIILIAYVGGIHLAARQQPKNNASNSVCMNAMYEGCNDTSEFFWFNQDQTCLYDLRLPVLSGLIFMLDGGPGNHEDDILQDNLFFTIVYLGFAFTIIVVMLNILIAQLSETYGEIIRENAYHYKLELVVTLELKSNLAFWLGRYFRKYIAIGSVTVPLSQWNRLKEESPKRRIEQLALDTNIDLNRTIKLLETEFEKVTRSNEELNRNVNGLSLKVNEINELTSGMAKINNRLDLFEERFKEMLELLKK